MVVYSILVSLFARQICVLFGLTYSGQQRVAIPALIISSLSLIAAIVNNIFTYYYMTTGRTQIANKITLCRDWYALYCSLCIIQILGVYGIWISFLASEVLTLLAALIFARQVLRKEKDLRGMLLLDNRDIEQGRYISFSVATNVEAVVESSAKISEFCENCSLNPRQSMIVSLAIEKILILMVQHVFADKKDDSIDVKIFVRKK
jgi:hypothetical protein